MKVILIFLGFLIFLYNSLFIRIRFILWSMTISDGDVTTYVIELYVLQNFRCHLNTTLGKNDSQSAIAPDGVT